MDTELFFVAVTDCWCCRLSRTGPGVIEENQIERTDPDVLAKYGGGEVWPYAAAWDLGETLPNNNYYESDELAVSRDGVCGDIPQVRTSVIFVFLGRTSGSGIIVF